MTRLNRSDSASPAKKRRASLSAGPFMRDYGMIFVLLLLVILLSVLTRKEQHPTGSAAGQQVADAILSSHSKPARVLIVTRDIPDDIAFANAAAQAVTAAGGEVLAVVNGDAGAARKAIETLLANGQQIDAIAANEVTARWTVYDRFPDVGSDKCVTPRPYMWPDFLKQSNLLNVAEQTAIYAIIAVGMTMVIITGGIDLSVGSLVALSAVTSALLIRDSGGGASAGLGWVLAGGGLGILVCAAAGFVNGWLVTRFQMAPFIVTLGMMMIASGLAFRLTGGVTVSETELPAAVAWLGAGKTAGIPRPVLLMLALYLFGHVVMSRTVFGRYVYAIGGNVEAARLSGVPVSRVLLTVYVISGALAGLGGVVTASQLSAGDPKFGMMYELDVIAAVVVGGTSLMGGRGKIFGTLIGAFIIAVIRNGMNLMNVDPFNQKIALGIVLIAAVLLDTLKRRGR